MLCRFSYYDSNEIIVVNLASNEAETFTSNTKFFPHKKRIPKPINDNMGLMEATLIMDDWDFDVSFGSFELLPNDAGFCRLVRGETLGENKTEPELFLEVFDNELQKIGEVNLTKLEPNLSTLYFPIGDRLFFKAKNQENENYLNYYFVDIEF